MLLRILYFLFIMYVCNFQGRVIRFVYFDSFSDSNVKHLVKLNLSRDPFVYWRIAPISSDASSIAEFVQFINASNVAFIYQTYVNPHGTIP